MHLFLINPGLLRAYLHETNDLAENEKAYRKGFNKWTGKSRMSMYENALKYPKGDKHLEYFVNNPHPEIFSDSRSFLFEAFNEPINKNNYLTKRIEFENVKRLLGPKLSEFERELLSLPDVLQKEIDASSDKNYIAFLTHLRDCFYNYFSTPIDPAISPDIQWINPQFVTSYGPAQKAINDLKNNLFNDKVIDKLKEKLREAGAFGNDIIKFYLWNTSPYNWEDISFQSRPVKWWSLDSLNTMLQRFESKFMEKGTSIKLLMPNDLLPDQYGALGNFTINAIPEGYVKPKGNNKYDICIDKMYYFINDSFNFEGLGDLSLWELNKNGEDNTNETSTRWLENSDFRYFRRHGYGREFPVLSRLHEIEDFKLKCLENQDAY